MQGFATQVQPGFLLTLLLILCGAEMVLMLEEPDDILQVREILWNNFWKSFQATWDDDSMLPIIWTGEASHVTPTYLPPPSIGKHPILPQPQPCSRRLWSNQAAR